VTFPAGSFSRDTEITIEEGAAFASTAFVAEFDRAVGTLPVSRAVIIHAAGQAPRKAARVAIPLDGRMRTSPPVEGKMVVLYNVKRATDAEHRLGVMPRRSLSVRDGMVEFETEALGAFQVAWTQDVMVDRREKSAALAYLSAREERGLVATRWEFGAPNWSVEERRVIFPLRFSGLKAPRRCVAVTDEDLVFPWSKVDVTTSPERALVAGEWSRYSTAPLRSEAHTAHIRYECLDQSGRLIASDWSTGVPVPASGSLAPVFALINRAPTSSSVSRTQLVTAEFSQDVDPSSLAGIAVTHLASGEVDSASASLQSPRVVVIAPRMARWDPNALYEVEVDGVRSRDGKTAEPVLWQFRTGVVTLGERTSGINIPSSVSAERLTLSAGSTGQVMASWLENATPARWRVALWRGESAVWQAETAREGSAEATAFAWLSGGVFPWMAWVDSSGRVEARWGKDRWVAHEAGVLSGPLRQVASTDASEDGTVAGVATILGLSGGSAHSWNFGAEGGVVEPIAAISGCEETGLSPVSGTKGLIVCRGSEGSVSRLFFSFRHEGQWSASAVVTGTATGGVMDFQLSSLAGDPRAAIVWSQTEGALTRVRAQLFDGQSWMPSPVILDEDGTNPVSQSLTAGPVVARDRRGNVLALWGESRQGATWTLKSRLYNAADGAWKPVVTVGESASSNPMIRLDSLQAASQGKFVILWSEAAIASSGERRLRASVLNVSAGVWEAIVDLGTGSDFSVIAASMDRSGNAHVLWKTPGGGVRWSDYDSAVAAVSERWLSSREALSAAEDRGQEIRAVWTPRGDGVLMWQDSSVLSYRALE
jgi:hypothetical protein